MAAEGEEAAVMAVATAAREAEEAVGCTQADTVSYKGPGEGERGSLGATAQATGRKGTRQEGMDRLRGRRVWIRGHVRVRVGFGFGSGSGLGGGSSGAHRELERQAPAWSRR